MLHTTDLMLGNWVEYAVGGGKRSIPMQVTGIFSDTVYLNFEGNEGDVFEEEEENLLGIEITPDLLLKEHFEEHAGVCPMFVKKFHDLTKEYGITLALVRGRWNCFISEHTTENEEGGSCCSVCPKYLHQLQNAYFMLTGKQLEVRL